MRLFSILSSDRSSSSRSTRRQWLIARMACWLMALAVADSGFVLPLAFNGLMRGEADAQSEQQPRGSEETLAPAESHHRASRRKSAPSCGLALVAFRTGKVEVASCGIRSATFLPAGVGELADRNGLGAPLRC